MTNDVITMQGLGNTFVICQGPKDFAAKELASVCDEHSVDGFLIATPMDDHNVQMQYWNADGSKAEMCGNGLRCVVRFAVDNHIVKPGDITVHTDAGKLQTKWDGKDTNIEVQVGKAISNEVPVAIEGHSFYEVNVGNPHAITFVEDVASAPVDTLGPIIETNEHFPHKTNVEFVRVDSPQHITLRVWERSVGETKACGTGMVATACLTSQLGSTRLPVTVEVPGGSAKIWLDETGYFRMLAPAEYENSKL